MQKHNLKKFAAAAAAAAIALSSSGCVFLPDEEEVLPPPVVNASEVTYTTLTVTRKDLTKQLSLSGTIDSLSKWDLSFSGNGGNLKKLYVHAGDVVEEGDLIAELETYDLDYEIEKQELYVRRAELTLEISIEQEASQAEIDKNELEIQLLQNELDKLYEQKDSSKLYASNSGTVSYAYNGRVGDWINPGVTIATVVDTSDLFIKLYPDDDTQYKIGRDITVKYNDVIYDGIISNNPTGEIMDGFTVPDDWDVFDPENIEEGEAPIDYVEVKFVGEAPPSESLGNLGDTVLVLGRRENVIVISNNVIKTVNDRKVVYLFKNNRKVEQEIEIGLQTGSESEIISGLEGGDLVIIR